MEIDIDWQSLILSTNNNTDWLRRRMVGRTNKVPKNLCPMCFQPKKVCWDTGEKDLEATTPQEGAAEKRRRT